MVVLAKYWLWWNSNDLSGNGYNWTDANMSYTAWVNWQAGSFNWTNWAISLWTPTALNLAYNNTFTLSAWIKTTVAGKFILTKDTGAWSGNSYRIRCWSWQMRIDVWTTSSADIWTKTVNDWFWHHVLTTNDWTNAPKMYIDSVYIWVWQRWTQKNTATIYIWRRWTWDYFNWLIDEVIIDNTVRSNSAIKNHYALIKWFYS